MRKTLLSLVLLSLVTLGAQAQSSLGIRGGASFFNFGGEDARENDYTNRAGFHAGLYASINGESAFVIEPGVYYSVKGSQTDDAINSRAVLSYVDVPLLFRLKAGEAFNFFAGPQVSFLANSKFEGDFGGSTVSLDTDSVRDTDAAVVFGLGYNLPQGFNIQGSYDYGFTTVFKDSDADVYNRGFKVSLGYTF
ncbi:porin family protein [Algoriphagus vanfongensis]|uniref:porin family protein n=1 Tax=Algoriphagus vanfongensis TaxID=426371 RepID=UPI0004208474|nr:porin family protein [Algoriphagus vanfongensis]